MSNPLTIDNLGPSASERYAHDEVIKQEGARLIADSGKVAREAAISVTVPAPSEGEEWAGLGPRKRSWALFTPFPSPKRVREEQPFALELIPSMRLEDTFDTLKQKIEAVLESPGTPEQLERVKKSLNQLLDTLRECNKNAHQAYNGTNQFHRG